MKVTRLLLVCFFALTLGAAGCGGSETKSAEALRPGVFSVSMPAAQAAARTDEFVFVDAQINGAAGVFILDSGADAFVVSPAMARRAGLPYTGSTTIVTIAGSSPAPVVRIDEFTFASVTGRDMEAAVVEIDGLDGIIGLPFFRAVVVGLNYAENLLELYDPAAFDAAAMAEELGAEVLSADGFVLNDVLVDGRAVGPVRIDTGNSGGLRLSSDRAQGLLGTAGQVSVVSAAASNGRVPGVGFIAGQLAFGGFSLSSQFVVVQQNPLEVGLIGTLILQQFYIVFDLPRGQVMLRQDRELLYRLSDPQTEQSTIGMQSS